MHTHQNIHSIKTYSDFFIKSVFSQTPAHTHTQMHTHRHIQTHLTIAAAAEVALFKSVVLRLAVGNEGGAGDVRGLVKRLCWSVRDFRVKRLPEILKSQLYRQSIYEAE